MNGEETEKRCSGWTRARLFAERNIAETLRSPVSWLFGLLMPIGIFIIMQVVLKAIGSAAASAVPMFEVQRFTGGVVIFGASFLSLFAALNIANDRQQSFLSRLTASPMRPSEYIAGYMLGVLPLAAVQTVIVYVTALCFGLNATPHIPAAALFSTLICVAFVSVGVIIGSALSAKSGPPICSAVVQVAVLLSGMWFDLDAIGGGFDLFCHILPFANAYDVVRFTLAGEYANVWVPLLITAAYTAVLFLLAVFAFSYRRKRI